MPEEQRRFSRVPFIIKTEMTVDNVLYVSEAIDNISVGGCLLPLKADLKPGTECFLVIVLNEADSQHAVRVSGKILRCQSGTVAVKFTEIEPDSLYHLRNIIRYNHPDSDKIDQELSRHPGLR